MELPTFSCSSFSFRLSFSYSVTDSIHVHQFITNNNHGFTTLTVWQHARYNLLVITMAKYNICIILFSATCAIFSDSVGVQC